MTVVSVDDEPRRVQIEPVEQTKDVAKKLFFLDGVSWCEAFCLKRVSSPQKENSIITYSPSCCSKPPRNQFVFGTQMKIIRHLRDFCLSIESLLTTCVVQTSNDRFALHNIRKIRPFLTEHAVRQLLVQALVISRLDHCNALLAGLPSNTIKSLQMIQNAAARLVFNEPKRAHVTPLFVSLHWLPVAARIQFKTLMLAYRTTTGSAPTYFHSLLRIYIPSRSLRSASERRLVVPSQRGSKSLSRTFSFTVPGRWNDLPTHIRNAGSLSNFKQQLKTHLFQLYLTT